MITRNTLRLLGKAEVRDCEFVCHVRTKFCHFSPAILGSPCLELEDAVIGLIPVGRVAEQM